MADEVCLLLCDVEATRGFARRLAAVLRPGDVVALAGDLGTGKTELARALIRSLAGAEIEVPSPSFTLVQRYELPTLEVWHADLYRLRDPAELDELGLADLPDMVALLVEWPEQAGDRLPDEPLWLELSYAPAIGENARRLVVRAGSSWRDRVRLLTGRTEHG